MTQEEYRKFASGQIAEWRRRIFECDHCAFCRDEIVKLMNLMPPDPIVIKREQYMNLLATERGEG